MPTVLVQWRFYGSARLKSGRFASQFDEGVMAEMEASIAALGEKYAGEVADRFAAYHGRTGETEASIRNSGQLNVGSGLDGSFAQYIIAVGGHIDFVIKPISPHWIPLGSGVQIAGPNPPTNRPYNLYSPFGPRDEVYWYQGGAESYSPDTTWYTAAEDALKYEAGVELTRIAKYVQMQWDALNGDDIIWSAGQARMQWGGIKGQYG